MTAVTRVNGAKLLVRIGDGGDPETFAHDCIINTSRGIKFQTETDTTVMPDCDNPEDPAWQTVQVVSKSVSIDGAGMLYTQSVSDWFGWYNGGEAKNIQFAVDVSAAAGGGYWSGAFKLTSFDITGAGNKSASEVSVTLESDGAVTWTDAS